MAENSPRGRRRPGVASLLAIAGVVGVIVAALWIGSLRSPAPAPVTAPVPATPVTPVQLAPPPLDRAALIQTAEARAAGDGAAPETVKAELVDRRFRVRIPFGCDGPQVQAGSSQAYFQVDAGRRTVKLAARPTDLAGHPLVTQFPDAPGIEALETFWIPRPWARSEACPARRDKPAPPTPTPPSPPTLGLAALFEPGGSRLGRRDGRPYERVLKIPEDDPLPLADTYVLVLEGRLTRFPSGETIRCWSETPAHRPVCVYAALMERVAFETPDGKVLAEWDS